MAVLMLVLLSPIADAASKEKVSQEAVAIQKGIVVQMSAILQNLMANGYVVIRKINPEKGFLKADTINVQGQSVKVSINPQSGEITEPKLTKPLLSPLEAVKKVEAAGYHDISSVDFKGANFLVKGLDQAGKSAKVNVDASSGAITKASWFS